MMICWRWKMVSWDWRGHESIQTKWRWRNVGGRCGREVIRYTYTSRFCLPEQPNRRSISKSQIDFPCINSAWDETQKETIQLLSLCDAEDDQWLTPLPPKATETFFLVDICDADKKRSWSRPRCAATTLIFRCQAKLETRNDSFNLWCLELMVVHYRILIKSRKHSFHH